MKQLIGIDIDDVLAAFKERFLELAFTFYGFPPPGTQSKQWDFLDVLNSQQIDFIWRRIKNTQNFWLTLGKVPGTELLKTIDLRKNELFFVTARIPTAGISVEAQTVLWLQNNYGLENPFVIVSSDKAAIVKELGLQYFIDDKPETCVEIMEMNPQCYVALKEHSQNSSFQHPNLRLNRVKSLNQFILSLKL